MRLSRYIFLVIICFLSFKFAISKDFGEKIENRLDGIVKRGWNEQFQANGMLERHKQLARLFTALHLQAQFTDDNLAPEDFLAAIWDLKNGAVLDKLIQLNSDGIIQELESVMLNVSRIVTNDEKILTDLKDVSEQFESVRSAMIDNWNKYQKSDKPSKMDGFEPSHLFHYEENIAQKTLDGLSRLGDKDGNRDFLSGLLNCSLVLKNQELFIESMLKIEQTKLEQFVESMGLIDPICTDSRKVVNISELLTASKDYISKFSSVSFNISEMKNIKRQDKMWSALQENHLSAFDSKRRLNQKLNYDLSYLDEDLQNSNWLKEVLNETEIDRKLSLHDSYFEKFDDAFHKYGSYVRSLHYEFAQILNLISDLNETDTSFASKSEKTANCFNVSNCWAFNEFGPTGFRQFPEQSIGFRKELNRILKATSEFPDKDNVLLKLDRQTGFFQYYRKYWDRSETEKLLEKTKPFYEQLVMDPSSMNTTRLLQVALITDLWKMENIDKNQLFNDDCKSVFDFDASPLKLIRNVSMTYFDIQKRDLVSKLKKLMETIPTMEKLRNDLRETVEKIKQDDELLPKNVTQLKIKNRENLLKFSSAVYCLERIRKIDELDAELGIFIAKGDEVVKAVETTKFPKYKNELEKIWGDWPEVKVKLERFRRSVAKMMLQIRDTPEKSLEKIGQVYFWLSAVRLEGSFDLRKYRESLRLLDTNPAPELEEALQKLEVPLSMDWDLVHMNFARMPEVMRELQKDFDCFFDEKKCPEELKDRSMIMMEQYRKNMEKFYKIDLRKQLLSLAYGWSMAMGPPGLLLLTWLWIVGKFNKHYYGNDDDYETESDTDSDSDSDDGYTSTDSNESNTAHNGY